MVSKHWAQAGIALLVAGSAIAVACGGDDATPTPKATTKATTAATAKASTPAATPKAATPAATPKS
jgi:hypothetical protein